jgi:4-amino-4-deoxy-L-arabinose transferase-like glycosyltransferase
MDRTGYLRLLLACSTLLLILVAGAAFWWLADRSDSIAFLPSKKGAEWIVYPSPAESDRQRTVPLTTTFRTTLRLGEKPSKAELRFRAFKTAGLMINGHPASFHGADSDWKTARIAEVGDLLVTGTNKLAIEVTNSLGPPALWLRLELADTTLGTDETWEASLAGAAWQKAVPARRPPAAGVENPLFTSEHLLASLKTVWPLLLVFLVAALLLLLAHQWWLGPVTASAKITPARTVNLLLAAVVILRVALFIHDAPLLPRTMGFDAVAHEEYIRFIQEQHSLPLPKDGWEMYQPPLYYIAGAVLLGGAGCSTTDPQSAVLLKAVNCGVGLAGCWLTLLCLRLVCPNNFQAQAAGLLFSAFLAPHLYLSQFVTNELLTGVLVTAAFYAFLRALETKGLFWPAMTGVALGAAMLTKFSALPAIPLLLGGLALQPLLRKESDSGRWWRSTCVGLICCVLVCGWHYARIWAATGKPFVANWETVGGSGWWQSPGFRVAGYYFGFGEALSRPLFSSFHSFGDGLYSTLWGDGLAGGAGRISFRPPWNYDLMNAGYALAALLSLFIILGIAHVFCRTARKPELPWIVALGFVILYGLAILYMSLRVPSYAQVKVFYASPAALPLTAIFVAGWSRLAEKRRAAKVVLWLVLLTWCFTSNSAFWVQASRPEVPLVRGTFLVQHGQDAEALEYLQEALTRDTDATQAGHRGLSLLDRADAHFQLALALDRQGNPREAIKEYRAALAVRAELPAAANNLAWLLATCPEPSLRNGPEAVEFATQACRLTHDETTVYLGTLAAAQAEAGQFSEAVATAQKAINCARLRAEQEIADRNRQLLEFYQGRKAYHEGEDPNR